MNSDFIYFYFVQINLFNKKWVITCWKWFEFEDLIIFCLMTVIKFWCSLNQPFLVRDFTPLHFCSTFSNLSLAFYKFKRIFFFSSPWLMISTNFYCVISEKNSSSLSKDSCGKLTIVSFMIFCSFKRLWW